VSKPCKYNENSQTGRRNKSVLFLCPFDYSTAKGKQNKKFEKALAFAGAFLLLICKSTTVDMPAVTLERVKGMVGLSDAVKMLIDYQLHDGSDV